MLNKQLFKKILFYSIFIATYTSCIINDNIKDTSGFINPGTDPNFKIVVNTDTGFNVFNRKVIVFDIPIYAYKDVEDVKLLHTANILAQYLDNNEDGLVDNIAVHSALKTNKSFLFMWKTSVERDAFVIPTGFLGNNLGADEVFPIWHTNGHLGSFDAALEKTWTHITNGFATSYPTIFGNQANSEINIAMDVARGGTFQNPPATYPTNAWFTKTEVTCNYQCQTTLYNYWVMTSILGAQENRLADIANEWKLNTSTKVQTDDVKAWAIFNNSSYKLPTVLPDGTYKH